MAAAAVIAAGLLACSTAALAVEAAAKSPVNVRTGPGKSFGIVDQLTAGEVVDVTECAPSNFCFVTHDGPDGWVSADFLTSVEDDEEPPEEGTGSNPDCSFGFTMTPNGPSMSINCGDEAGPGPAPEPEPEPEEDPGACFYVGNNFGGNDLCVPLGTRNTLNATFNNKISSVQLFGGAKAKLCEDPNLGGYCRTISGDTDVLHTSINNKASSLAVYVGAPPMPEPPEPPEVPDTLSTGPIELMQTYTANLDNGNVGGAGTDIWYEAETAVEKYITPQNGASIAVGDGSNRGYEGCFEESFSTTRVPLADIPPGTYVCVKTNQGRISQFRVNGFVGTTMKLGYTTWSN
jgi:hypothetical protein